MSDSDVFIYALCEPTNLAIRYVGKAADPESRYEYHLKWSKGRSHKNHWVACLLSKGHRPVLKILEKVPSSRWEEAERRWISRLKALGTDLTNMMDGGEGRSAGIPIPFETRCKMSLTKKGLPKTLQHREKISLALTGKKKHMTPEYRAILRANGRKNLGRIRNSDSVRKGADTRRGKKNDRSSSRFIGVRKSGGSWVAYFKISENSLSYVGSYKDEVEAAQASDLARVNFFGRLTKTNFMRNAE